jgi:uridine kinase
MIIGIEGGIGSGKTILMTRYLYKDFKRGRAIYSNYGLNFKHEPVDMSKILEMHDNKFNLRDCTLGIDEITVFADCRRSGSKLNRLISYFILQSRKRSVDIYFTTQNLQMIDFRLLDYMDFQILAKKVKDKKTQKEVEGYAQYSLYDIRDVNNIRVKKFVMNLKRFYGLYDTMEVILPINK